MRCPGESDLRVVGPTRAKTTSKVNTKRLSKPYRNDTRLLRGWLTLIFEHSKRSHLGKKAYDTISNSSDIFRTCIADLASLHVSLALVSVPHLGLSLFELQDIYVQKDPQTPYKNVKFLLLCRFASQELHKPTQMINNRKRQPLKGKGEQARSTSFYHAEARSSTIFKSKLIATADQLLHQTPFAE